MKVIFLDIDGVLNSTKSAQKFGSFNHLDPSAIDILNHICVRTGAKVVISSSWRHMGLQAVKDILISQGIEAEIIGMTPYWKIRDGNVVGAYETRGEEIQVWLDKNPEVKNFVIIDDSNDMGDLAPHLVLTSINDGLIEDLIPRILETLERKTYSHGT